MQEERFIHGPARQAKPLERQPSGDAARATNQTHMGDPLAAQGAQIQPKSRQIDTGLARDELATYLMHGPGLALHQQHLATGLGQQRGRGSTCQAAAGNEDVHKKELLFLKKKKQKNFCSNDALPFSPPQAQGSKSFLVLFFKKEHPYSRNT
jgi:hypothetical protein